MAIGRLLETGPRLAGLWIGHVDAHLLAAVRLTAGSLIWTRDKRLAAVATDLGLAQVVAPGA